MGRGESEGRPGRKKRGGKKKGNSELAGRGKEKLGVGNKKEKTESGRRRRLREKKGK